MDFLRISKNRLNALAELLETVKTQAKEKNISDAEVLGMKLADDMFPLSLQISLSIKIAIETIELFTKKSWINVSSNKNSQEAMEAVSKIIWVNISDLKTLGENISAIKKAISYIEQAKDDDFKYLETAELYPFWAPWLKMVGLDFYYNWALPNFMFHLITAYNILRNHWFNIWKKDFIGSEMPLIPAN